MKSILVGLNASFSHTNLAIRLLQASCKESVDFLEFTINHQEDQIVHEIIRQAPEAIFWSAYIWNWELIKKIGKRIHQMDLGILQFAGGPEVSFDIVEHMEDQLWLDGILYGEGEAILPAALEALNAGDLSHVKGLIYRREGQIYLNEPAPVVENLDLLPSVNYGDEDLSHKIVYYEGMRGCPFKCTYCLSSEDNRVRMRSLDKIKEDMRIIFQTGTKQIKFIDRTFNLDKERAQELIDFFKEEAPDDLNVHFEVTLELFDQVTLDKMLNSRPGLFQVEAGIQSTDPDVLEAIERGLNYEKTMDVMNYMDKFNTVHRHLDLIVGLPRATMETFKRSFDEVYHLHGEKIQVGFLKALRGTSLRREAKKYGIIYEQTAPYEVIKTDTMSAEEVLYLKTFHHIVEDYIDQDVFKNTNALALELSGLNPSDYFFKLSEYLDRWDLIYRNKKNFAQFKFYYDFLEETYPESMEQFHDRLRMDFYNLTDLDFERVTGRSEIKLAHPEIMDWLEVLDPAMTQEIGRDIKEVRRNTQGISLDQGRWERLIFYKNHKYVKHIDRKVITDV